MERSAIETEIKLRFESVDRAREALAAIGAVVTRPRLFEDNVIWDRPDGDLKRADKVLRLRRVGGDAVLTYKAPVAGEHRHKVRVEHETAVADVAAVERLLAGLGFVPRYRYQKYRTDYAWQTIHLCLDETPIGCFIEVEGSPEAIDRAATQLGARPDAYILETYRELHERESVSRGEAPRDLVFPNAGRGERA